MMTIRPLSMNRPRSSATEEMALEVCTSEPRRDALVPSPGTCPATPSCPSRLGHQSQAQRACEGNLVRIRPARSAARPTS